VSDFDDLDDDDSQDAYDAYDLHGEDDREEWTPEPEPEVIAASVVTSPVVEEEPPAPLLSIDERIRLAAAGAMGGPSAAPATTYSQETLRQIAANDPERYAALKEDGHALQKIPWGPDR